MKVHRTPVLLALVLAACPGRSGDDSTPDATPTGDGPPAPADGAEAPADGQPAAAFVVGYNFGGPGAETVTVDGHALVAQDEAGSPSLGLAPSGGGSLAHWATSFAPGELDPPVDAALGNLLNHHLSVGGGGLSIRQGLTEGDYQIYTYHLENNESYSRSFHIAVEGARVTAEPVSLAQRQWVKQGPFSAHVADGVLDVELERVTGDASIFGLEIYTTTGGQVQDLPGPPGWHLVWGDEFDTDGLPDPTRWDYEEGYVRNGELQYYTRARAENARVENGELIIEARRDYFEGHEITSASLHTQGKRHFLYGRFEVRAKLPTGLGTWPAIWMLGTNIGQVGWPACGEIDIMENVGFEPSRIYGTIHTEAYNHASGTAKGSYLDVTTPWLTYHVYALEWYPDHLDIFVDDTKYFTFANEGTSATWPFDKTTYLLLNFAFGGGWGGQQGVDPTLLPLQYHIDYVRVYEHD